MSAGTVSSQKCPLLKIKFTFDTEQRGRVGPGAPGRPGAPGLPSSGPQDPGQRVLSTGPAGLGPAACCLTYIIFVVVICAGPKWAHKLFRPLGVNFSPGPGLKTQGRP